MLGDWGDAAKNMQLIDGSLSCACRWQSKWSIEMVVSLREGGGLQKMAKYCMYELITQMNK